MQKMAASLLLAGSLIASGQASAHDHGGDILGALIGGAVIGAVVSSALKPAPVVAYQAPAYQTPVYQAPAYEGPPPGYCYDPYQRAYVACSAAPAGQYGYAPVRPAW